MVDVRREEPAGKAFKTIFDLLTSNLHTSLPGLIVDFDGDARTCSVQPALKRLYTGDEEAVLLPIQEDVPVLYPGSNEFYLEVELKKDDEVLCVVSERAIDQWLELGDTVDPQSRRRFNLSDIIVVPGLRTGVNVQGPVGPGIALRNATSTVYVRVEESLVTASVDTTNFEITATGIKGKPATPIQTDVEGYQPLVVTPPGIGPGYVSLVNHTHQVVSVGAPSGLPIPIPGPP
jgi:hypothetical protein